MKQWNFWESVLSYYLGLSFSLTWEEVISPQDHSTSAEAMAEYRCWWGRATLAASYGHFVLDKLSLWETALQGLSVPCAAQSPSKAGLWSSLLHLQMEAALGFALAQNAAALLPSRKTVCGNGAQEKLPECRNRRRQWARLNHDILRSVLGLN